MTTPMRNSDGEANATGSHCLRLGAKADNLTVPRLCRCYTALSRPRLDLCRTTGHRNRPAAAFVGTQSHPRQQVGDLSSLDAWHDWCRLERRRANCIPE